MDRVGERAVLHLGLPAPGDGGVVRLGAHHRLQGQERQGCRHAPISLRRAAGAHDGPARTAAGCQSALGCACAQAGHATRQVDLDRIEDEIDAILCAHLAWLWHGQRASMLVFGDVASGCIVTPALRGCPGLKAWPAAAPEPPTATAAL